MLKIIKNLIFCADLFWNTMALDHHWSDHVYSRSLPRARRLYGLPRLRRLFFRRYSRILVKVKRKNECPLSPCQIPLHHLSFVSLSGFNDERLLLYVFVSICIFRIKLSLYKIIWSRVVTCTLRLFHGAKESIERASIIIPSTSFVIRF